MFAAAGEALPIIAEAALWWPWSSGRPWTKQETIIGCTVAAIAIGGGLMYASHQGKKHREKLEQANAEGAAIGQVASR